MNLELTREDFWNYIKDARIKYKNNDSKVIDYLTEKLKEKTLEEIFSFGIVLDEVMLESYKEK
ncbi:MAG: DUF4240 domain-containing protein, partial [Leptotrichiaceae bacterium]|nr:DUF4240 domain-containing protein [Leptotrichiaceae bacterium]